MQQGDSQHGTGEEGEGAGIAAGFVFGALLCAADQVADKVHRLTEGSAVAADEQVAEPPRGLQLVGVGSPRHPRERAVFVQILNSDIEGDIDARRQLQASADRAHIDPPLVESHALVCRHRNIKQNPVSLPDARVRQAKFRQTPAPAAHRVRLPPSGKLKADGGPILMGDIQIELTTVRLLPVDCRGG